MKFILRYSNNRNKGGHRFLKSYKYLFAEFVQSRENCYDNGINDVVCYLHYVLWLLLADFRSVFSLDFRPAVTCLLPMVNYTPWKHQKVYSFFMLLWGYINVTLERNELNLLVTKFGHIYWKNPCNVKLHFLCSVNSWCFGIMVELSNLIKWIFIFIIIISLKITFFGNF